MQVLDLLVELVILLFHNRTVHSHVGSLLGVEEFLRSVCNLLTDLLQARVPCSLESFFDQVHIGSLVFVRGPRASVGSFDLTVGECLGKAQLGTLLFFLGVVALLQLPHDDVLHVWHWQMECQD